MICNIVNNLFVSPVSFEVVGYGCMTCIGNSGPLPEPVVEAITQVLLGARLCCIIPPVWLFYYYYFIIWELLRFFCCSHIVWGANLLSAPGGSGCCRRPVWKQKLWRACPPQHQSQLPSFSSTCHSLCNSWYCEDRLWEWAHWWVRYCGVFFFYQQELQTRIHLSFCSR